MVEFSMIEFIIGKTKIRIVQGDITEQNTDAIVNAANSSLMGGGGVDGAIHRKGGPKILAECKKIRETEWQDGLPAGKAVITSGGKQREPEILASAYVNSLRTAVTNGLKTVAFPSISTGAFGYPIAEASKVA